MKIQLSPSGGLQVSIPSETSDRTHEINIPATVNGVNFLVHLLHQQTRHGDKQITSEASPTQEMATAWLRRDAARKAAEVLSHYPTVEIKL